MKSVNAMKTTAKSLFANFQRKNFLEKFLREIKFFKEIKFLRQIYVKYLEKNSA